MWDLLPLAAAVAGEAVTGVVADPSSTAEKVTRPIVANYAGWAVAESIKWLLRRAQDIAEYPADCCALIKLLGDPNLQQTAHALDLLTDLPEFAGHRPDYDSLCDALQEAEALLLRRDVAGRTRSEPRVLRAVRAFVERVGSSGEVAAVLAALKPFTDRQRYMQLITTLQSMARPPVAPRVQHAPWLPPLNQVCGPLDGIPKYSEPALPKPIFKHSDDLVPRVDKLLTKTRNIGIVGMGGIGKTTIARAVFEHAKSSFKDRVWLTVGGDAKAMLPLLETAFTKLYPGHAPPFQDAENGVSQLAQRLYEQKRSVLLVLDDVWLSSEHAVVAALNFATCPEVRTSESRLIVTTRDRRTLSYNPGSEGSRLMHELQIVEPALLDEASAQQLFHHHAFGAFDATPPEFVPADTCSQLVGSCGGNPLALKVLGSAMQHCDTPAEWDRRLASQRERQDSREDDH